MFAHALSSQDPNGAVTRDVYDTFGRLCRSYLPGDPYAPAADPCQPPNLTTDAPSKYVVYALFANGMRIDTYAKVSRTRYLPTSQFFDAFGRPVQTQTIREVDGVEKLVVTESLIYDGFGRVFSRWSPMVADGTLDTTVRQVPPLHPTDGLTYFYYDEFGRLVLRYNADRTQLSTSYQTAWVTRSCDANHGANPAQGQCVEEEHDFAGRLVERRVYLGSATGASWYSKERHDRDRDGRRLTVTQNDNPTTAIVTSFDLLGRKATVDDPDTGGSGSVGRWTYGYDKTGDLVYEDDPEVQQHLESAYDGLGRLVSRTQYKGNDAPGQGTSIELAHFTYDCRAPGCGGTTGTTGGAGRLCKVVEHDPVTGDEVGGTEILAYDIRGNVRAQTKTITFHKPGAAQPTAQTFTAEAVYDTQTGLPGHATFPTGSGSERVYYRYSGTGQLQKLQSDGGEYLSNVKHDVLGRTAEVVTRTGIHDRYDYRDAQHGFYLDRIQTWSDFQPGSLRNVHYRSYDPDGNVAAIRDELYTQHDPVTATATVFYDRASRVRRVAQCSHGPTGHYDGTFVTDPFANLTTKDSLSRTLGAKPHQLASILSRDLSGSVTSTSLGYDRNGDLTQLTGGRTAAFDVQGHLLAVTQSGVTKMLYRYDYKGGRVIAYDADRNETIYFFGGFDVLPETGTIVRHFRAGGRLIASSTVTGVLTAAAPRATDSVAAARALTGVAGAVSVILVGCVILLPRPTRRPARDRARRGSVAALAAVVWMVQLPAPGVALAAATPDGPSPPGTLFYHLDHLGTPRLLSDESGAVVEYLATDAYGLPYSIYAGDHVTARTQSRSPFQFTGHRAMDAAGLVYMGARFYDPVLGQFLSHDPAGRFSSPYSYTNSNPVNITDPNGADPFSIIALILIIASVVYAGVNTGVQASANGASLGEAIGAGFKAAAITGAIAAVGWYAGGTIGAAIADANSTTLASIAVVLQLGLAGYQVYNGVEAIANGNYAEGSFALAFAALALAGAAYTVSRMWHKTTARLTGHFGGSRPSPELDPGKWDIAVTSPKGKVLATLEGGTIPEERSVADDIDLMLSTSRGRDMVAHIEEVGPPVQVMVSHDGYIAGDRYDIGSTTVSKVWVDPNAHPLLLTTRGWQPISTPAALGHEFGHAVFGLDDIGPGRMANVLQNENPIREALHEDPRIRY